MSLFFAWILLSTPAQASAPLTWNTLVVPMTPVSVTGEVPESLQKGEATLDLGLDRSADQVVGLSLRLQDEMWKFRVTESRVQGCGVIEHDGVTGGVAIRVTDRSRWSCGSVVPGPNFEAQLAMPRLHAEVMLIEKAPSAAMP